MDIQYQASELWTCIHTISSMFPGVQAKNIGTLPNVNSFVDNPEAERAVNKAEGPGIGITGMLLLAHNLACIIPE